MQVDIEDCEWEILENINIDIISEYFSQILFEFHNCNPDDNELSSRRFKVLEKLNTLFVPIHTHFNNHGNIFYSDGLILSDTIEVSYINKKLVNSYQYKSGFASLVYLDSPNTNNFPDIPVLFPKK